MELVNYRYDRTLLFLNGMFAQDVMWEQTLPHIKANKIVMKEALCEIGSNTDEIADAIISKLSEPVTWVTNSLGGLVGMRVAAKAPELVEELIISGSPGFGAVNLGIKVSPKDSQGVAVQIAQLIYKDPAKIDPKIVDNIAACFKGNLRSIVKLIRESNAFDASELIKHIQCPITALWGSHDQLTPLNHTTNECFLSNDIKVHIMRNIGHSPMLESPDQYASKLNEICTTKSTV